jgi:polar amino acid transport system permease protein
VALTTRARRRWPDPRAVRSSAIALVSTVVVFGVLGWAVVNAPGWPQVQAEFLDGQIFATSLPDIVEAFWINVVMFIAAEILVLFFGLVLAIMRGLPGPVFLPFRVLSNVYTDIFRALPALLVIFVIGYGIPALGFVDPKTPLILYGILALTLIYSAFVAEVYRAGMESIHPSQSAAARSLGLSHLQTLRYVVVPQAVRRVIPPLLNDFIGLQKDTVLVTFIGVVEIFRMAQIKQAAYFNFTPFLAIGLVFLVVTIPLIHVVDWLVARDRRRAVKGA